MTRLVSQVILIYIFFNLLNILRRNDVAVERSQLNTKS